MVLALTRTPDILATVAAGSPRPFVVGFAAETQNVERNALAKLEGKQLDMIAANQVGDGLAFDCDDNALTVYWPDGKRELPRAPKCTTRGGPGRGDRRAFRRARPGAPASAVDRVAGAAVR